jgi:two-component system cell cycle sensor histidine kinase/response regulator CckA
MSESLAAKGETILVVEDQSEVLEVVTKILERAGFLVLTAASGPSVVILAAATERPIHLLLSDVDMPAMSGPELGQVLKKQRPELRIMLMSGGSHGNLLVLNYGWAYIEKPFVPVKLVAMIRAVLDSPDRSQGTDGFDSRKVAAGNGPNPVP